MMKRLSVLVFLSCALACSVFADGCVGVPYVACGATADEVEEAHWVMLQRLNHCDVDTLYECSGCGRCSSDLTSIVPYACDVGVFPRTYFRLIARRDRQDEVCGSHSTMHELCKHGCSECTYDTFKGMEVNTVYVQSGIRIVGATTLVSAEDSFERTTQHSIYAHVLAVVMDNSDLLVGDITAFIINLPLGEGVGVSAAGAMSLVVWCAYMFVLNGSSAAFSACVIGMLCFWSAQRKRGASQTLVVIGVVNFAMKMALIIALISVNASAIMPFLTLLLLLSCIMVGTAFAYHSNVDVQYVTCMCYAFYSIFLMKERLSGSDFSHPAVVILDYVMGSALPIGTPLRYWYLNRTSDVLALLGTGSVPQPFAAPAMFLTYYCVCIGVYIIVRTAAGWGLVRECLPKGERAFYAFIEGFAGWGRFYTIVISLATDSVSATTGSELSVVIFKIFDVIFAPELAIVSVMVFACKWFWFQTSYRTLYVFDSDTGMSFCNLVHKFRAPASHWRVSDVDLCRMMMSGCVVSTGTGDDAVRFCGTIVVIGGHSSMVSVRSAIGTSKSVVVSHLRMIGKPRAEQTIHFNAKPQPLGWDRVDPVVQFDAPNYTSVLTPFPILSKADISRVCYLVHVRPDVGDFIVIDDFELFTSSGTIGTAYESGLAGSPFFAVMRDNGDIRFVGCASAENANSAFASHRISTAYGNPLMALDAPFRFKAGKMTAAKPGLGFNSGGTHDYSVTPRAASAPDAWSASEEGPFQELKSRRLSGTSSESLDTLQHVVSAGNPAMRHFAPALYSRHIAHLRFIARMCQEVTLTDKHRSNLEKSLLELKEVLSMTDEEVEYVRVRVVEDVAVYLRISILLKALFPQSEECDKMLDTLHDGIDHVWAHAEIATCEHADVGPSGNLNSE